MKKSKIILPALGMLLLSTAASVTGTVAWFTTVSTANAQLSSFAIRKLGGELALNIKTAADGTSYGVGTRKYGDSEGAALNPAETPASDVIVLKGTNPALCDASYKHTSTASVYKSNSAGNAFNTIAESAWAVDRTTQITYYAVSWTLEFTYTFGGDTTNVNLYFDLDNASLTAHVGAGSSSNNTWKGFRIAFVTTNRTVVWAGGKTSAEAQVTGQGAIVYQSGASTSTVTEYADANSDSVAGDLITGYGTSGTYAAALHAPTADQAGTGRADYIGSFTSAAPTLSVKCIAWFEGNDPNVVNGATMDTVDAVMAFYTRTNA